MYMRLLETKLLSRLTINNNLALRPALAYIYIRNKAFLVYNSTKQQTLLASTNSSRERTNGFLMSGAHYNDKKIVQ